MATRGRGEAAADDEFLHNLYRGGELLAAGKVIEAKDYLERAFKLQPKNEKGQNLLGLTYFKLGLFDRAAEIYEALVRENPVDATLRVNLGLVYLKTNQLQRAIREFETSVDLAPEHQKAHNYLGLALAQLGNYAEAKEHFLEAGSDAMAQKMERLMSGEATGLHRMPAPLEQQQKGFAEIEGSEVVAERGGQQVAESRRPEPVKAEPVKPEPEPGPPPEVEVEVQEEEEAPGPPAAAGGHEDWGSHFGEEAPPEEELRFAEDEGPKAEAAAAQPPEGAGQDVGLAAAAQHAAILEYAEVPPAQEELAQEPESQVEAEAEAAGAVMTPEELAPQPVAETGAKLEIAPPEHVAEHLAHQEAREPAPAAEQWAAVPLAEVKDVPAGLPLAELAPTLEVLGGAVAAPFDVQPDGVRITVQQELLTRVDGLLLCAGGVKFEPELKRFRGRTTDQAFGEGGARMTRATGKGVLVVSAGEERRFVAVDLAEESAYFREEVVYAFEEAVMFENGRIPSEVTGELDLVHLRGKGKVLLKLGGPLRAHQVRMDEPATVPLERLVGWFGNVTPRLLPLAQEESGALVTGGVELSGEGFVLFTA